MTDFDSDLESDLEAELEDLRRLTAALEDDEPGPSRGMSQFSVHTSQSTINSVQDDFINIDTAIALNKLYDEKLQGLEKMLINRLNQCRQKLREVQCTNNDDKIEKPNYNKFKYIHCGKPYFKDEFGFPAPDNEDTLLRAKAGMYDFASIQAVPGWTIKDKNILTKCILKLSREIKRKQLNSQLAKMQRLNVNKTKKSKEHNEIQKIKKKLNRIDKMPLKLVALPIDEEYDWDFVAKKLNHRHRPQEFRALWKLFLHPSINKTPWCEKEDTKLQDIVKEKEYQDWDAIAKELNTGRTAYQCFVYFRTNMGNNFILHNWTKDEEEYLKRLIEYYREDNYIPWSKIASSMENRTKIQVYNKYLRMSELRKGRFLPEEDAVILTFADKYGTDFKRMTWFLPGRSVTQCRTRYHVLSKKKVSIQWTAEEDRKLIQLMSNQDVIKNYSSITKHFPGKDRVHIRSRHMILERWMMSHPNLDIAKAPRRGPRLLNRGNLTDNLNKAIENLKARVKSDIQKDKSRVVTINSSEQSIDDAIIDFFVKQQIKTKDSNKLKTNDKDTIQEPSQTEYEAREVVNVANLQQVLILLKAKLNKEKFMNSSTFNQFPQLHLPDLNIYKIIKKSYSKMKNGPNSAHLAKIPDVFGNNSLGRLEYVLPPNYATITGCRKLINYVSNQNDISRKNLSHIIHNNSILRDQMSRMIERFHTLFMWPVMLSNRPPHPLTARNVKPINYQPPERKIQPPPYQRGDYLSLPKVIEDDNIISDVIDLDHNNMNDVTLEQSYIFRPCDSDDDDE
ncbi:snRNA-activating protein complex subunit 4 [Colias croceus]|uniref:snRNA-activating protein complex subunit 4 n=1 Tax=Colias crocea TaxID=72248 RepID=UPI001E27AF32|nr:snRNA-activating protein complex subunit 4 [Colias croceus]